MEVLVLDGKSYVKASKAARDLGYATDYVGQLCRSGQVDAHLIGRTWYVDQEQLGAHRVEKKRMSRAKAREQAKALIASNRTKTAQAAKRVSSRIAAQNLAISYEPDEAPLIPETRKLTVSSEDGVSDTRPSRSSVADPEEMEIEKLSVRTIEAEDAAELLSEDEEDTEVRPIHVTPEGSGGESERRPQTVKGSSSGSRMRRRGDITPISFIDRLQEASVIKEVPSEDKLESSENGSGHSLFIHVLFQVVIVGVVLASCGVRAIMTYDTGRIQPFQSHFLFSIEETVTLFKERF